MNSADALLKTLIANGLEVVFANPGTSEMHLVAAIDHHPEIRPVLGLFEGVVSGAADGYARMSGKAAANLLHLGPGLGNAFANIHNAKKARTPMLNIVGDHATYHLKYDAPLTSDLDGLAKASSDWVVEVSLQMTYQILERKPGRLLINIQVKSQLCLCQQIQLGARLRN